MPYERFSLSRNSSIVYSLRTSGENALSTRIYLVILLMIPDPLLCICYSILLIIEYLRIFIAYYLEFRSYFKVNFKELTLFSSNFTALDGI